MVCSPSGPVEVTSETVTQVVVRVESVGSGVEDSGRDSDDSEEVLQVSVVMV